AGMRYRLLETVAEYARERLVEAGERAGVERRHLTYYRELARRTDPELRGPGQVAAIARFETEHDNLRGALRTAVALGDEQEVLCLVHCLGWFWQLRNHHVDARTWAVEAGRLGPDPFRKPVRRAEPLDGRCADVPPPWTGARLWEARRGGRLYALATEGGAGATALERPETRARLSALVAAYRPGLPQNCRQPGTMWYFARLMTGELTTLDETLTEIVDACRDRAPGWDLGFALLMRAKLAGRGADADGALALFEAAGDSWGTAESLAARGEAYELEGRLAEAAADFERATAAAARVGARSQVPVFTARSTPSGGPSASAGGCSPQTRPSSAATRWPTAAASEHRLPHHPLPPPLREANGETPPCSSTSSARCGPPSTPDRCPSAAGGPGPSWPPSPWNPTGPSPSRAWWRPSGDRAPRPVPVPRSASASPRCAAPSPRPGRPR
ncbi:hypothetical protein ABZ054_32700, partial [Streptomyces sp. NPDC006324]